MSSLPPGPRLPAPLQTVGWVKRPLPFLETCQRRYGDSFTLRMTHWGTWVVLSDPADVKAVFTADARTMGVAAANPLLWPVLGQASVMLLEEPRHMQRRKTMLPPFHGERLGRDGEMMAEVTRRAVREWPIGEPFALWPRMQEITQEVVMRAVFGDRESTELRRLRVLLRRLTEWLNDPGQLSKLALFGPRMIVRTHAYRQAMEPVEEAVLAEVRRRRAEAGGGDDVVSLLAMARHEDGSPLDDGELRDEMLTLLTDGPTSASLARVFERLLRHPEKLARVREEALEGGDGTYIDAVVKETLRLCAPVPVVVRRLGAPLRLGGRELPAGTVVAPCVHLVHRRADVYPRPRSFLPERFLEQAPGTYTWIPFGGGVRRCLAARYSELEMARVLRTVLQEMELQPLDSRPEGVRRGGIAFSPDRRGLVIARPRGERIEGRGERWEPIPT